MSRKRRGPVSPTKVGVGLMTGGLSLFFTGVRKKYPNRKKDAHTRYKAERKSNWILNADQGWNCSYQESVPPYHVPSGESPITDIVPHFTKNGWIIFSIILVSSFFCSFISLGWPIAIFVSIIVYFLALGISETNKKNNTSSGSSTEVENHDNDYWYGEFDREPGEHKMGCANKTMEQIDAMDGHAFEHYIAELLKKIGYQNVSVAPGSGDQGVDVLAELNGVKYAIQCKNYSSALGNTPVQEVSAGKEFYGCHVGVVVTNNYFTRGGTELADRVKVILWDRDKLSEMISLADR